MDWMFVFLLNSYTDILSPNVMIFRDSAFGELIGHEGASLTGGISSLIQGTPENLLAHLSQMRLQQESSCQWSKKWTFTRHWISQSLDLGWNSQLWELWEINVYCFSHLVYGISVIATWKNYDTYSLYSITRLSNSAEHLGTLVK